MPTYYFGKYSTLYLPSSINQRIKQDTHTLDGPIQSLWQNAPHCLQIIIALTSQAKGFWVFGSEGEGGLGKSGTPYDFSIILLPPLCFIFGKIRLGSLLFVTTAFAGFGLTPLVCFSTT